MTDKGTFIVLSLIIIMIFVAVGVGHCKFQVFEDGRWYDYGSFTNYQSAQEEVIATNEATIRDLQAITNAFARDLDRERMDSAKLRRENAVKWWTGFLCGLLPAAAFMLGVAAGR